MTTLHELARALGGKIAKSGSRGYVLAPGPGHSPRDLSMSVTLSASAPDGFVVYSHAGDDWRTCRDHVMARLGGRPIEPYREPARTTPKQSNSEFAIGIWNEAIDARGTLAEKYLTSRALELPDDAARFVRFHPRLHLAEQRRRVPAMVTLLRNIHTDAPQAIQRTFLADDCSKITRMMLGPSGGAAIKITADENVEQGLHVGEGFETCLAGWMLGLRPVWALGSADAIRTLPVLGGIETLTIFCETDDKGANAAAVRECGNRWVFAGRKVVLGTPQGGGDINAALMASRGR